MLAIKHTYRMRSLLRYYQLILPRAVDDMRDGGIGRHYT